LLETYASEERQSLLRAARHEYDNVHHLNSMTDLPIAIGVIGVITATFGLGCTTVGLLGSWRNWAKTHFPSTHLGRRV